MKNFSRKNGELYRDVCVCCLKKFTGIFGIFLGGDICFVCVCCLKNFSRKICVIVVGISKKFFLGIFDIFSKVRWTTTGKKKGADCYFCAIRDRVSIYKLFGL